MTLPKLSKEQQNVLDYLSREDGHVFLTGKAGTGKTTVLRALQEKNLKNLLVCAPTGVAAHNADGVTIHNLFGLGTGLPSDEFVDIVKTRARHRLLMEVDAIVIDEISMVSSELLDSIDRVMREIRYNHAEPFGGVQIIMFGDLYQLPPVRDKEFEAFLNYFDYKSQWFFHAKVWNETDFKTFGLVEIFRQNDGAFKDLLNAVRDGTLTEKQLLELNDLGKKPRTKNSLLLGSRRAIVNDFNTKNLRRLRASTYSYKAMVNKGFGLKEPADREIKLKDGAHVMMLSNDREDRWVNGTPGVIVSCRTDNMLVRVNPGTPYELVHDVSRYSWIPAGTPPEHYADAPKFTQFPVKLAWGVTIHKSQGMSLDDIEIDLATGAFDYGQTYVALSRVKTPAGLHLKQPIRMSDVKVDPHVRRFFDSI